MSCEHAFLALLDALEIQRSILGDAARGADADNGPHRAAFESLERSAITEANRLTADASVAAVVRARARAFVTAATRTPTRSGLRAAATPTSGTVMPRMATPVAQIATVAVLPRAPSGTRPSAATTTTPMSVPASGLPRMMTPASTSLPPRTVTPASTSAPPRTSPSSAFPGLAAVGAFTADPPSSATSRVRVEDHLSSLAAGWSCAHCGLDIAHTLHVSRVFGGRNAVVVDVVCANCSQRSPLPQAQFRAFDRLFGPYIGQSGGSFRPDSHGLLWDGT